MMGRTHAATGVLLASTGSLVTNADVPSAILALTLLPGFALLPDIDHADSTVSKSFGFWTQIPSLFLKHRRGTHSLGGITVFALLTWLAVEFQGNWLANTWLTLMLAVPWIAALRALKLIDWKSWIGFVPVFPALAIAWFPQELADSGMVFPLGWLPLAVWFGMFTHVMGDIVTKGGCPLLWPISKRRFMLNWFATNSTKEKVVHALIWIAVLASYAGWFALTIAPSAVT